MCEEKSKSDILKEKLFMKKEHTAVIIGENGLNDADSFAEGYMNYLDASKTEREAVEQALLLAKAGGFTEFNKNTRYPAGSKVYVDNRGKSLILAVIGHKDIREGVRIAAAHVDAPRLDLKPNPLYEESEMAYFKTHYYGGIKKYQWTAIPLALHGVIVKKDGEKVSVNIGDKDDEPKFVITDLLPHLAANQMRSTMAEGIKGETLNILIGSRPFDNTSAAESVKLNIMNILFEKYGVIEEDFLSAELEAVPAFSACDIGFDRSLIGAYGHDDRVCAYPALMAILDCEDPDYTSVTVLTDKEETGSEGNTGLDSKYLEYFIWDLAEIYGTDGREVLSNSKCLSADVNAAYDPNFPEVYERRNTCFINNGVCITKYTGSRGKGGTSDASAEFMGEIRSLLDTEGICWQTGELGKVDEGGGGTVAKYIAHLNVDVVDLGVPVLSMHAPFEVVSKTDVYMAYRAFLAFFSK
ncbi:MAG: aminopeptidase [Clostridia bacterium]|nr:aminopeptidase [Clostridia bacterium]